MLCNVCDREKGWGKLNQLECGECSSKSWIYGSGAFLILVVIVVIVLIYFKSQYNSEESNLSAYSRISLITFRYSASLHSISLTWTSSVKSIPKHRDGSLFSQLSRLSRSNVNLALAVSLFQLRLLPA